MDNYLTKFELTKVLGTRAEQLARGAPCLVDIGELQDPLLIAEKELREHKIPLKIRRTLPNGSIKDFAVSEMYFN
jgi:DNA-directed RNA polymerase I, II, and III subunit RPABC2